MKLPEPGFKFTCGVDICEFPIQYCDTEDNRCGYCSVDLCNSGAIPQQCATACNGLSITTVQPVVQDPNIGSYYTSSDTSIYGAYIIATIALLLVVMLYLKKAWKRCKNGKDIKLKCLGIFDYHPVPINNDNNRSTNNIVDYVTIPEGHEQDNKGIQKIPTAPPEQQEDHAPSTPSYTDTPIVTQPDDDGACDAHNPGDHNILPPTSEDPETNSFRSSQSNGPVSQAMDDSNCETRDHHILSDSKDFKINVQDTTDATQARKSTKGAFELYTKPSELTVAKEKNRPDKVC